MESIVVHTLDAYDKLCQDLIEEASSFDISSFYESDDSKKLIVITPNQVIVVPVYLHHASISRLYQFLYSRDCDYSSLNNIIIRLDSSMLKLFVPMFPKRINSFQSEVFSYFYNQLKDISNIIKFDEDRSLFDLTYEDVKEEFNKVSVDDSFISPEENIISLTREDWRKKNKVA